MCIIIQRKPEFVIPYDKFEASVLNNPDGYGLAFNGDKGLEVIRSPTAPDVDKLYRFINEELIDKELMLHLRFTTAGATNLRNAHPFPILEKRTDGIDLRMCHNGTLGKYRTKAQGDESDTRNFVKTYVRPLFKRLVRGMEPEELLSDPFVKELLEDQITAASVLTFFDSEGNSLICNPEGNGGKQEEGWYYSNTYSFNPKHRVSVSPGKPMLIGMTGGGSTSRTSTKSKLFADTKTPLFSEKFRLNSIRDALSFTDETIRGIVNGGSGENAELLIKELLREVDTLYATASRLYRENTNLKKKVEKTNA